MEKFENLDNDQKELVRYWFAKWLETDEVFLSVFIEKHLSSTPVIEAGKWYKYGTTILFYCTRIVANELYGYGFGAGGGWREDNTIFANSENRKLAIKATHEEVEIRLIEEAKRRGYKNGNYIDVHVPDFQTETVQESFFYDFGLRAVIHGTKNRGNFLMKNGQWAEIIDEKADIRESVARLEAELNELKSKL